ncbi:MAG: hypothetical protein PVG71_12835 [Anaerolineae bacterium]|jgi:hypothetical protein
MGTRAELVRARGHYYRLYTKRFRGEREQEYDAFRSASIGAVAA